MTETTVDDTAIESLTHHEAMRRQVLELERTLTLLRSLGDEAWTAATDCPAWDVRAMYQHVRGACEAGASGRENTHQLRAALPARPVDAPHRRRTRRSLDAVEFCRTLAGRAPATGLLTTVVPF
jgi:hypothetical protein